MTKLGEHLSEEAKRKISESKKLNPIRFWLGKKRPDISQKISNANKGKHFSPKTEFKNGSIAPFKGRIHTEEAKQKNREKHLGKNLGNQFAKGYKYTPEQKMRVSGKNSHNWKGGSSFEPYSVDWTDTLKKSIRERDKYTCQICGKEPSIVVHHIDYNKKNCNPDNLITLCIGCHSKTNHNIDKWINYFKSERGII